MNIRNIFALVLFLGVGANGNAADLSALDCTTTEKIRFAETMRGSPDLNRDLVREAVLVVLGKAAVNPAYSTRQFKGRWAFESEQDNVIYAGLNVRSHYLQLAVVLENNAVTTVVCDSQNLKQKKRSIHRKVPAWKLRFDTDIRTALGQAALLARTNHNDDTGASSKQLNWISKLRNDGILTDQEYSDIKQRILNKNQRQTVE